MLQTKVTTDYIRTAIANGIHGAYGTLVDRVGVACY